MWRSIQDFDRRVMAGKSPILCSEAAVQYDFTVSILIAANEYSRTQADGEECRRSVDPAIRKVNHRDISSVNTTVTQLRHAPQ